MKRIWSTVRGMVTDRIALARERDALLAARDALMRERDALMHERNGLMRERDALMRGTAPEEHAGPGGAPAAASTQDPRPARTVDSLRYGEHGVLAGTAGSTVAEKSGTALAWQYRERSKIALAVAGNYAGGDYLEFGSDGMGTFRNFLSAYDINQVDQRFPDTRFFAFDIFGHADPGARGGTDAAYFERWQGEAKKREARNWIERHGLYVDRCEVVAGYFEDTVPAVLERYRDGTRKIGFAFLDCNITSSYRFLLGVLPPAVHPCGFIYMDEYHVNPQVPPLFQAFLEELRATRGFGAQFVRSAGVFGALFRFMGHDPASHLEGRRPE